MSPSDVVLMQKPPDDTTITWRQYEALRDHLQGVITRSTHGINSDIQVVQMKVDATENTDNAMQVEVNDLHTSIQHLTQSVNGLLVAVEARQHEVYDDAASVHDEHENLPGQGPGHGIPGQCR
jgi:hypothetical protein